MQDKIEVGKSDVGFVIDQIPKGMRTDWEIEIGKGKSGIQASGFGPIEVDKNA